MKKRERTAARSREEWRELVREWKASGSTAREFAGTRGLSVTSLFYWSSVLKREELEQARPKAKTRLVPVRVAMSGGHVQAEFELVIGHARLRFRDGASPQYVAALAHALTGST